MIERRRSIGSPEATPRADIKERERDCIFTRADKYLNGARAEARAGAPEVPQGASRLRARARNWRACRNSLARYLRICTAKGQGYYSVNSAR